MSFPKSVNCQWEEAFFSVEYSLTTRTRRPTVTTGSGDILFLGRRLWTNELSGQLDQAAPRGLREPAVDLGIDHDATTGRRVLYAVQNVRPDFGLVNEYELKV